MQKRNRENLAQFDISYGITMQEAKNAIDTVKYKTPHTAVYRPRL